MPVAQEAQAQQESQAQQEAQAEEPETTTTDADGVAVCSPFSRHGYTRVLPAAVSSPFFRPGSSYRPAGLPRVSSTVNGEDLVHAGIQTPAGTYTCDRGCGFRGAYDTVLSHEALCYSGGRGPEHSTARAGAPQKRKRTEPSRAEPSRATPRQRNGPRAGLIPTLERELDELGSANQLLEAQQGKLRSENGDLKLQLQNMRGEVQLLRSMGAGPQQWPPTPLQDPPPLDAQTTFRCGDYVEAAFEIGGETRDYFGVVTQTASSPTLRNDEISVCFQVDGDIHTYQAVDGNVRKCYHRMWADDGDGGVTEQDEDEEEGEDEQGWDWLYFPRLSSKHSRVYISYLATESQKILHRCLFARRFCADVNLETFAEATSVADVMHCEC